LVSWHHSHSEGAWLAQTVALFGLGGPAAGANSKYPIVADEEVMKPKAHGTSEKPVMKNLKWGADFQVPNSRIKLLVVVSGVLGVVVVVVVVQIVLGVVVVQNRRLPGP
jgi:hypothetical protein